MFWPLATNQVPSSVEGRAYLFSFEEADTQALNAIASRAQADVCAVSAIHAIRILDKYQPLLMGASVGTSYGPVVVGLKDGLGADLWKQGKSACRERLHLLTPGETTTAHTVAQIVGLNFCSHEAVPIVPLERVFQHLKVCESRGQPTVALLIHEGRLTFTQHECIRLMDIGELWTQLTGASLPLGLNVIHRKLSQQMRHDISKIFIESCQFALKQREQFIRLAQIPEHSYFSSLSSAQLRHYLDLYANETTVSILERDKLGFLELLKRSQKLGFLPDSSTVQEIDWI